MAKAIDAITGHYNGIKEQFLDVPEWGDGEAPLRIYWNRLTIESRRKLLAMGRDEADILVGMAIDRDGTPMFTIEDKPKLRMHADEAVIRRVALAMVGDDAVLKKDVDAAEKN